MCFTYAHNEKKYASIMLCSILKNDHFIHSTSKANALHSNILDIDGSIFRNIGDEITHG